MSFSTQSTANGGFAPNFPGLGTPIAGTELPTPWPTTQPTFGGGDSIARSPYAPPVGGGFAVGGTDPGTSLFANLFPAQGTQPQGQQGALGALVALFTSMLSSIASALGLGSTQPNAVGTQGPQLAVQDATVSSLGDPHLSATGTAADGTAMSTKYDSMTGHRDLVDSDSFTGGYRVSTRTTVPDANGIAWNKDASVTSGNQTVSLDNAGNATIRTGNVTQSLESGQTVSLLSGATVSRGDDGAVTVHQANDGGGTIETKLLRTGDNRGVDVVTTAHNADLGGDIMDHAAGRPERHATGAR